MKNRVGEKYLTNEGYEVEIIEYFNAKNLSIVFKTDIKNIITNVEYSQIKKGQIKNPYHNSVCNVGYVGEGVYPKSINSKITKSYTTWYDMINRCYSEKELLKRPTYKDVTVCEEWYNFQNFAKWFEENYNPIHMINWHLDKDILVNGNRVYSPETCCFVPNEINLLFKKDKNGKYNPGVFYDKRNNKYRSRITFNGKEKHIGYYDTELEAHSSYIKEKLIHIKKVSDKWRSLIGEKVYNAMYNYKIK